jgi:putative holliday junction resolvase
MGLDIGDRRVGVAFGDSELHMATPAEVIVRASHEQDVRGIADFVRRYEVTKIIVGLPRNIDGTLGPQAQAVIAYTQSIASQIDLPVEFWDERLSTVEATKRTHETGARGKKSRRNIDAIAAAVILQDYLDSQPNEIS